MVTFNPVQRNAFFATKQLLALMNVNIKAKTLTDLLVSSRDFPSLAAIVETLETLKIKNLPISIKEEQLKEIPLPAIAQLIIDGDVFVPIRKIENQNVEWCHEKKGWQSESLTEFAQKWNGVILLVDDSTTFYAKKEFTNKSNFIAEYSSVILSCLVFVSVAYFLGFFDILLSLNWQTLLLFIINLVGFISFLSIRLWNEIDENKPIIRQESQFFRNSLIDLKLLLFGLSLLNLIICYWFCDTYTYENLFDSVLVFLLALSTTHILFSIFRRFRIVQLYNKKLIGITQGLKNNKTLLRDSMSLNKLLPPVFKGMEVIEIGNQNPEHTLLLAGDPTDSVFSSQYFEIKELVNRNENLKMQLILFPLNYNYLKISQFIEILLSLSKENQLLELERFLNQNKKPSKWLESHKNIEATSEAKKIFGLYRSWLDISEKKHFPILALNGIEIPNLYRIDDIEFIIENQIVK